MVDDRDPTAAVATLQAIGDRDSLFEPINSLRRRTIVRYLSRLGPQATTTARELAYLCAAVELDCQPHAVSKTDFRRLRHGLRQRDLTRLALANVIDRDDDGHISRGRTFRRYECILRTIDSIRHTGERSFGTR